MISDMSSYLFGFTKISMSGWGFFTGFGITGDLADFVRNFFFGLSTFETSSSYLLRGLVANVNGCFFSIFSSKMKLGLLHRFAKGFMF